MAIGSASISAVPIASSGTELHTAFASTLVSNLRPFVSGCPDFVIEKWARYAYIEFCKQTGIVRRDFTATVETTDPDSDNNDQVTIDISSVMADHRPVDIRQLFIDSMEYTARFKRVLTDATYLDENVLPSKTRFFYFPSSSSVSIFPFTDLEDSIELYITADFQPHDDVETIPGEIFDEWHETIEAGALERLFKLPKRKWSDRAESERYRIDFWRGIMDAKAKLNLQAHGGELMVEMRGF